MLNEDGGGGESKEEECDHGHAKILNEDGGGCKRPSNGSFETGRCGTGGGTGGGGTGGGGTGGGGADAATAPSLRVRPEYPTSATLLACADALEAAERACKYAANTHGRGSAQHNKALERLNYANRWAASLRAGLNYYYPKVVARIAEPK